MITKGTRELNFEISRKPTTTNTIIPNNSYHPLQTNLADIRYFANSNHTYNLDHLQYQKEIDTVKQIIHSNKYNTSLLNRIGKNTKQIQRHEQENQKQIWVMFTFIGRAAKYIKNVSKTRLL